MASGIEAWLLAWLVVVRELDHSSSATCTRSSVSQPGGLLSGSGMCGVGGPVCSRWARCCSIIGHCVAEFGVWGNGGRICLDTSESSV